MRAFFFVCFFSLSLHSFAADYYWQPSSGPNSNNRYATSDLACQAMSQAAYTASGWTLYGLPWEYVSNTFTAPNAICKYRYNSIQGVWTNWQNAAYFVRRYGDSCPVDTVLDSTSGNCVPNPCKVKEGQSQRFQKTSATGGNYGNVATVNGKPFFSASTTACFNGCTVSTADQKCTARVNGAYVCRGTAFYTGTACATGEAAPAPVEATTQADPAPITAKTDQPCTYSTAPDGTKTCTSIKASETEGQQCGTVNGVQKCVAKSPSKDESKIDTTVTETSNPDGSTTTTKKDTLTKTTCSDYAPSGCKTTTTTTTSTSTKNSAGELIGSIDSSCEGPSCATDSNPDGDGDGLGDCTGSNCGEDEEGNATNKPTGPALADAPSYAQATQTFMTTIKSAPIYATVSGLSVPSGGSCSFGSAQTFFGAISFDDFCNIAPSILNPLRYLFLAIWAWAAIRLFFTA